METKKRYCLNCGKEVLGRAGKMFCSDICRNTFNNKQNKDATNLMERKNNRLRKIIEFWKS
jgi:predicted nucleic acid-binding Zn ribbon protein